MKKKILLIICLTILFITNVNAETVNNYKINYPIHSNISCGNVEVYPEEYIEKTGKLIVTNLENDDESYIWNEGNVCEPITAQDYLDLYNYHYEDDISVSGTYNSKIHVTSDVRYVHAVVKALGTYDENKQYYTMFIIPNEVTNSNESDFDNYWEYVYLRSPETTVVDENETYYKQNGLFDYVVADINEINENNIYNYYILTTKEEINYKETLYTMDEAIFNNLISNYNSYTYFYIDNEMILMVNYNDGNQKYYKLNGEEITEYRNKEITISENFFAISDLDDTYLKIYDHSKSKLIYSNTYDNINNFYGGVILTETSAIIDEYDAEADTNKFTLINVYKLMSEDNQVFDGSEDITIKFSGQYESFRELKLNGVVVLSSNYTVSKGSTVIKLKKSYLDTLSNGTYTFSAVYNDGGYANSIVNVEKNIHVKISDTKTIDIEYNSIDTIETVKQKIQDKEGFPILEQTLIFNKEILEDTKTLTDYNIKKDDTIYYMNKIVSNINITGLEIPVLKTKVYKDLTITSVPTDHLNDITIKWFKLDDEVNKDYCSTLKCLEDNATLLENNESTTFNSEGNYVLYITFNTINNSGLTNDYSINETFDNKIVTLENTYNKVELFKGYTIDKVEEETSKEDDTTTKDNNIKENPKTGDNININILIGCLSLMCMLIVIKKHIK